MTFFLTIAEQPTRLCRCLIGALLCALLTACGIEGESGAANDAGAQTPDASHIEPSPDAAPEDDPPDTGSGGDAADASETEETDASDTGDADFPGDTDGATGLGCEDSIPLTGTSGTAPVAYALDATGAHAGSCGGEGPERVFSFTLSERALYQFSLSGDSVDGVLYLRGDCQTATDELNCDDGLSGDVLSGEIDAGTWHLFADAYAPVAEGEATLSWSLTRHPCLDVQCGEGASCELMADGATAHCLCDTGFVHDGTGCVADPCADNPCSDEQGLSCAYSNASLPAHMCVPRAWTVLVYLSADNDLFGGVSADLEEMRVASLQADSQNTLTIFALVDGPLSGDTRLVRVDKGEITALAPEETFLGERGELDMADGATLREFGLWAIAAYPAERYGLVLWDHGSGWKSGLAARGLSLGFARGFSIDLTDNPIERESEISISSGEYAQALETLVAAAGQRFDFIAFDACQMGLYEVAHASAPYADFLIASEERVPARGFPYDDFFAALYADESLPVPDVARALIDAYVATSAFHYTLSATDLTTMALLDTALDDLSAALLDALLRASGDSTAHAAIATARAQTLAFHTSSHRDLGDFAWQLSQSEALSASVRQAAEALGEQLVLSVPHAAAQGDYERATGLAIYLPDADEGVDEAYFDTGALWSQATRWGEFLTTFARHQDSGTNDVD